MPFVTLYDGGWDHHADIFGGLTKKLPPFENAIAALIEDLDARGLLETTLVVALGEFGRTPKISTLAGQSRVGPRSLGQRHVDSVRRRRHAGRARSSAPPIATATRPTSASCRRRISSRTVYRKLGIDPGKIYHTPQGRPTHLVSDPTPISELMG